MSANYGQHSVANISTTELRWTFCHPAPQAVMELCLLKGHTLNQSFFWSKHPKMLCLILRHNFCKTLNSLCFVPIIFFYTSVLLSQRTNSVFHAHFYKTPHPALLSSCMSASPWSAELMLCLPGYPQITHKRGVRARLMRFFPWSSAKKSSSSNQSKWSLTLCRLCVHLIWHLFLLSKTVIFFAAFVSFVQAWGLNTPPFYTQFLLVRLNLASELNSYFFTHLCGLLCFSQKKKWCLRTMTASMTLSGILEMNKWVSHADFQRFQVSKFNLLLFFANWSCHD